MATQTMEVPTDAELLQAQADLWRHSLYYLTSMGLRCAVELEIPTTIHHLGGVTTLPDPYICISEEDDTDQLGGFFVDVDE